MLTVVLIAIAYQRDRTNDPGVTTEVALFITFLIGVTTVAAPAFAAGAAVVVASLLAMRSRLHDFSTRVLTARELHDALLLAAAAGFDVAIVTMDKDFYQLISPGIALIAFLPRSVE